MDLTAGGEAGRSSHDRPVGQHWAAEAALASPAVTSQSGQHDVADGELQDSLGLRQGVIQLGTFLQLRFIKGILVDEGVGSLATGSAQSIDFIRQFGRAANWESGVVFC